jgi:hypothetical protein
MPYVTSVERIGLARGREEGRDSARSTIQTRAACLTTSRSCARGSRHTPEMPTLDSLLCLTDVLGSPIGLSSLCRHARTTRYTDPVNLCFHRLVPAGGR